MSYSRNVKNFRKSNIWKRVGGGGGECRIWEDKEWRKTTKLRVNG